MSANRKIYWVIGAAVLATGGCMAEADEGEAPEQVISVEQGAAIPGPWAPPEDVLEAGLRQKVPYEGTPPWENGKHCRPSYRPGTLILAQYMLDHFPAISHLANNNECKPGEVTGKTPIHATGRAVDLMVPQADGDADNDSGDPIGNFLMMNAEVLGVQYIIWDHMDYLANKSGGRFRSYKRSNPHTDHLHVELAPPFAEKTENWFEDKVVSPSVVSCPIPPDGKVVEERENCVKLQGSSRFWRSVETTGSGGSLYWTNSSDKDYPQNGARWNLSFEEAGTYLIEVHLVAEYAEATAVNYKVFRGGEMEKVTLDQSAAAGWVTLGNTKGYAFAAGDHQWVSVYDHMPGHTQKLHICVDALRLTRLDKPDTPADPDASPPEADGAAPSDGAGDGGSDGDGDGGTRRRDSAGALADESDADFGCSIAVQNIASSRSASFAAAWAVVGLWLASRRRSRSK